MPPTAYEVLVQQGYQFEETPSEEALALAVQNFVTLEDIERLEAHMLELEQVEVPTVHRFLDGVYMRQVTLPKGTFAIGHAHKHDCHNIVLSGSASVMIDGRVQRITGPCVMEGKAFDRKVGYIHEDITWITVHPTKETDLEKLEEELLIKSETFKRHERRLKDRVDYRLAIAELGMEETEVRGIVENTADMVPFFLEVSGRVAVAPSNIQGDGLFAMRQYGPGRAIVPARIGDKRTPAGRFTNHAKDPNAEMRAASFLGIVNLVALREIGPGEEITVDYRKARQTAIEADKLLAV